MKEKFKDFNQNNHVEPREQLRIKINRLINSCPRQKTSQNQLSSRISTSRKTNRQEMEQNWNFHEKVRQSRLNSLFRIRKEKLESLTKVNKEFYERLNSQSSRYGMESKEKQKNSFQKPMFTFRTVDSRQSRQILGPIHNFNIGTTFSSKQKRYNQCSQNQQNELNPIDIIKSSKLAKRQFQQNTPLKRKLTEDTYQNNNCSLQLSAKNLFNRQLLSSQNFQNNNCLRTPQRKSRLPELYFCI